MGGLWKGTGKSGETNKIVKQAFRVFGGGEKEK